MALIGLDGREVPNGCDWFPDSFLWWSWRHCCDFHDVAYTVGGTDIDRLLAELQFYGCLNAVSPLIAPVMVLATFLLGYAFFNNAKRRRR